jgi:hypothetical protein
LERSEEPQPIPTGAARGRRIRRTRPRDDPALVAAVLADPNGPAWRDELSRRLFLYARRYLLGWARAGTLRQQAKGVRGIGRVPQVLPLSDDQAESLVTEVLALALRTFTRTSLPKWDAVGGRSVDAYFVTWCFMKFPDAYDAWRRREGTQFAVLLTPEDHGGPTDERPRPEDVVATRDAVRQLCERDPTVHRVLVLVLGGHKLGDIETTMVAEGVLKSEVRRARRRLTDFVERLEQGDGGSD